MVKGEEITEPAIQGRIITRSQRRKGIIPHFEFWLTCVVVQWTSIPVKLKILKLFVKELGNILEGKEVSNGDNGEVMGGSAQDGWESDDEGDNDGDDWEDVGEVDSNNDDPEAQEDILKGVNTEVRILKTIADF
jgi:hypothetical protein